jgi:hypothetical protein
LTTSRKRTQRDTLRAVIDALPELRRHGAERVRVGADGSVEVELDTRAVAGVLTPDPAPVMVPLSPPPQPRDGDTIPDPTAVPSEPQEQEAGDDLDVAHLG